MNDTFEKVEGLTQHVKDYINTKIDLTKLRLAEKTSLIVGNLIAITIITVLFLFVILFGSIAGAWVLSDLIGRTYSGFLIVAGFYLLLGIIVWFARNRLIRFPVMNSLLKLLYKKDDDDNDKDNE